MRTLAHMAQQALHSFQNSKQLQALTVSSKNPAHGIECQRVGFRSAHSLCHRRQLELDYSFPRRLHLNIIEHTHHEFSMT